jgi:hypothetical protein
VWRKRKLIVEARSMQTIITLEDDASGGVHVVISLDGHRLGKWFDSAQSALREIADTFEDVDNE